MVRVLAAALLAAALNLAVGAVTAPAHEGHDHGGAPAEVAASVAPRASSVSELFEVVAVARGGVLSVYVDRFDTNEAVAGATVEAQTPAGLAVAVPQPDGSYRLLAPWSAKSGDHELIFTVSAGGQSDVFPIELYIPDTAATSPPLAGFSWLTTPAFAKDIAGRLTGSDWALASSIVGFLIGVLLTALVRRRMPGPAAAGLAIAASLAVAVPGLADEGHDHGAASPGTAAPAARDQAQRTPDGAVFVPKPTQRILGLRTLVTAAGAHGRTLELPGRIIPDPNASGFVQASAGGRLSAPADGFPRLGTAVKKGDVLSYVTPPLQAIDVSDMRQRQGELDQQIAIVERRLTRLEPLSRSGAIAQAQLDEARLELAGLRDRRTALDRNRRDAEPLLAPVDGIVAEANAAAGMMAQPSQVVFQIIEPSRLWVEALSFELTGELERASAQLGGGRTLALAFQGSGLAGRNQAVPIQFRIEGDTAGLRVGQFVTVYAVAGDRQEGLALPRASIVRSGNGQPLVYEHTEPEQFEPREVRVEPLDGERVFVAAGIEPGRRVVTQGAELLNQVR